MVLCLLACRRRAYLLDCEPRRRRRRLIRLCLLAASDQRQPTNPPTLTVCCTAWPQGLPADEKKKRMIEFGSSRLLLCYLVV